MKNETTLRIERLIDAPIDAVFRAWTTREAMEHWYQDRPDDVVRIVELDVRVGGGYRIEFGPADQAPFVETGTYREIDPPYRLVLTESLDGPDGTQWADTVVTVTLEEDDGKTRLVLVHEQFPSTQRRDDAAGGWPGFLDRLELAAMTRD
jgi:uncharacterized protein YndB with AHSA1/START domain